MSSEMTFKQLGLDSALLSALDSLGYESPTPVQAESIPILLNGRDILAQAQTGTGKTAAFALPILQRLDLRMNQPQALVIAPTRELAMQVAEAFQSYAKKMPDFHVTPIYGGQDYRIQLRSLQRGPQVIVGTPGRVMDHLRRGTLVVDQVKTVVLDEADEMLKMGFIEDIEFILESIPGQHTTALFSATMPAAIQKIAKRYLHDAEKVMVQAKQQATLAIEQVYYCVNRPQKLPLLRRLLEVEDPTAAIIFVRTKMMAAELAEKLQASGFAAQALHGDMNQAKREKVIGDLRRGKCDLVVATDVAARGIDVERITHVFNYDIPCDVESYTHRIGRTGRAGRSGRAILLVSPRESRLLKDIERAISAPIDQLEPPSLHDMTKKRSLALRETIVNVIAKSKKLGPYQEMVADIIASGEGSAEDIAAAIAYMMQQTNPLPDEEIASAKLDHSAVPDRGRRGGSRGRNRHPAERRAANRRNKSAKGPMQTEGGKKNDSGKSKASGKPKDSGRSGAPKKRKSKPSRAKRS